MKRIFPVHRIQRWVGCVPQTLNPSCNKNLFFPQRCFTSSSIRSVSVLLKNMSRTFTLCGYIFIFHLSSLQRWWWKLLLVWFFILHRKQFIAWQDCMLLIDYLDVVYVIFGWCWWHLIPAIILQPHTYHHHLSRLQQKLSLFTNQNDNTM